MVDELQINTVVNCGPGMAAALGKIVTIVDSVYTLRKTPLPGIMEHCAMSDLNLPNQCLNSSRRTMGR